MSNYRIDKFKDFLLKLSRAGWREADNVIKNNIASLDEKTFDDIFFDKNIYEPLVDDCKLSHWVEEKMLTAALLKYSSKADSILRKSTINKVREIILARGLYSNVSVLDHVARNDDGPVQHIAAQFCSVDALRDIVDSRCSKVRKVVFQRLGPVECLDLMLSDKKADIREEGVRMAPFGYEKLNDMTKEIARGPFTELVGKISGEYLPMLLANRNLKNAWISNKLQIRLSVEGNENE